MRFSDEVLENAQQVIDKDLIKPDPDHPNLWWVTSLHGSGHIYRVQTTITADITYLTCTCAHGLHTGGDARCYHAAAACLKGRLDV